MSTTDKDGWQRTSPFAILFFIGRIIQMVAKNAWQSIAPLFVYISIGQEDLVTKLVFGGLAITTAIVAGSILSWMFFRYQIRSDSVLIRSGVMKKTQLDINFDRIQGVNTKQNPIYRALNLVTVTFDTAGSSGSEGNLPAVTREFATGLRRRIGGAKATLLDDDHLPAASLTPLIQLDWRDMIRIAMADRRALIIFAVIGPLMDKMGDRIEPYFKQALEAVSFELTQNGLSHVGAMDGIWIVAAIIIALFIVLAVLSIAMAILRYHKFKLFLDGRTLRSNAGLLTRHEHSMDLEKIQTLRLQQGIVQGWLKRYTMTARQAISGRKQRSSKMFTIPVVTDEQADLLRPMLFAGDAGRLTQNPRSERFQPVSPYYMRSRILFIGLLPALVFVGLGVGGIDHAEYVAIPWLTIVALLSWRSWKRAGYLHDDDEIVRRSGLFGFRTVGLLFRKVQRVTITQSRYQRRKNLASLRMYMASGSVSVPYIDHTNAQRLRDYILYRVESSQKAWH